MVHLRRLVGVRPRNSVARVYVVESHVSLRFHIVRYRSIHSLHRQLCIGKLAARRRLRTSHHSLVFLLNHLVAGAGVTRYSWSLNCADLASNSVAPVHHFVEDFLFGRVSVRLIFFANGYLLARVIANTEEIGSSVVATVRLRMIRIFVDRCHVTTCTLIRTD